MITTAPKHTTTRSCTPDSQSFLTFYRQWPLATASGASYATASAASPTTSAAFPKTAAVSPMTIVAPPPPHRLSTPPCHNFSPPPQCKKNIRKRMSSHLQPSEGKRKSSGKEKAASWNPDSEHTTIYFLSFVLCAHD